MIAEKEIKLFMSISEQSYLIPCDYTYGIHSPITDAIYRALDACDEQIQSEVSLSTSKFKTENFLPRLGHHVSRLTEMEMKPEILHIYEKQVRGVQLENYQLIKDAAIKELKQKGLSFSNELRLMDAIERANERILVVSRIFYENHPEIDIQVEEGVERILKDEKALLERNIKLLGVMQKKIAKKVQELRDSYTHLREQIKHEKKKDQNHPNLRIWREQLKRIKSKLREAKSHQSSLESRITAMIGKLNETLEKIGQQSQEHVEKIKPHQFLSFLANQVSDKVLEDPAKEIIVLIKEYLPNKSTEDAAKNFLAQIFGSLRDVIIARPGNRMNVFKRKVICLLPKAALLAGTFVACAYGSTILAALGQLFASIGNTAITAGAFIVANPFLGLGIVIGGMTIYGIGLLIRRNKCYFVMALTPLKNAACSIAQMTFTCFQKIKSKIKPSPIPLKLKPLAETSEAIINQLEFIAAQAKGHRIKANLVGKRQALTRELHSLERELVRFCESHSDAQSLLKRQEAVKAKQSDLRSKEFELSLIKNDEMRLITEKEKISRQLITQKKELSDLNPRFSHAKVVTAKVRAIEQTTARLKARETELSVMKEKEIKIEKEINQLSAQLNVWKRELEGIISHHPSTNMRELLVRQDIIKCKQSEISEVELSISVINDQIIKMTLDINKKEIEQQIEKLKLQLQDKERRLKGHIITDLDDLGRSPSLLDLLVERDGIQSQLKAKEAELLKLMEKQGSFREQVVKFHRRKKASSASPLAVATSTSIPVRSASVAMASSLSERSELDDLA